MASARQGAANRANARKSTGPRSKAGKRRTRRNASRHGFTATTAARAADPKQIERLARAFAGAGADRLRREAASAAAQAVFDLAQIRRAKVALIARILTFGAFAPRQAWPFLLVAVKTGIFPTPIPPAPLPATEPGRTAEALRRALPELIKLDRYERRAAGRRDRAIRLLV
jgi:hypothetical protein